MRLTLLVLALSVATLSATGPSHLALQAPAAEQTLFGFDPKWIVSTGGLLLCVYILTKLLRDERKDRRDEREENRKEREKIGAALEHIAAAGHAQALATQRNTDSFSSNLLTNTKVTERLASEVRSLADRRREDRS